MKLESRPTASRGLTDNKRIEPHKTFIDRKLIMSWMKVGTFPRKALCAQGDERVKCSRFLTSLSIQLRIQIMVV